MRDSDGEVLQPFRPNPAVSIQADATMTGYDELLERIGKCGGDPTLFTEASFEELREIVKQYERAAAAIAKHGRLRAIWSQ